MSERCAKTREIRASRFSIEILDPRERKFSLPIHLFANVKLKKERERERERERKRKGRRKNARACITFQRRFDVVHGQQLSLFIRRHVFVLFFVFRFVFVFVSLSRLLSKNPKL